MNLRRPVKGRIVSSAETVRSSVGDQVHVVRCRKPDHVLCRLDFGHFIGKICGFQSFRWLPGGGGGWEENCRGYVAGVGGTRCEPIMCPSAR